MTALDQYQRLEAVASWRPAPDAYEREVVVSFGNATLTLMDMDDAPRAHWSLAALEEVPGAEGRLVLSPDPDGAETLSLDDPDMIAAIRAVRSDMSVARTARRAWRLMLPLAAVLIVAVGALVALRGPLAQEVGARIDRTTWDRVSLNLATAQISTPGASLCRFATSAALRRSPGHPQLLRIAQRVGGAERMRPMLARFDGPLVLSLPGDLMLVNATALAAATQPEEIAGLIALAQGRLDAGADRAVIVRELGLIGTARLAMSGQVPREERPRLLAALSRDWVESGAGDPAALRLLATAQLPTLPVSLMMSDAGAPEERVEAIQQADVIGGAAYTPALYDADWLRLSAACD